MELTREMEMLLSLAAEAGWDTPCNISSFEDSSDYDGDDYDDYDESYDDEYEEDDSYDESDLDESEQEKTEENIQNKEDEAEELCEATSKTSEDVHGGDEATDSIEDSPSTSDTGIKQKGTMTGKGGAGKKNMQDAKRQLIMSQLFEIGIKQPVSDCIIDEVVEIAKREAGKIETTADSWDIKEVAKHLVTGEKYKLINDRIYNTETNSVLLFIDQSGSFGAIQASIREAIRVLSKKGYKVTVMDCGNGFNYGQATIKGGEDIYDSRNRLAKLIEGTTAKLHPYFTSPTVEDAIKLVNAADFSIIIADYDGFSSYSEVSYRCEFEKVPYFFDFEDRYDDPIDHDWVDEDYSTYKDSTKWCNFRGYISYLNGWDDEEDD